MPPKEEARDKTLTPFTFDINGEEYSLRQSTYHPSLWLVVKASSALRLTKVRLPDDSDLPEVSVVGEHAHIAAFLAYVDDSLAAGPRDVLQPLLNRLLHVWKGSNPGSLGREPGDVDTMRFLGLDVGLGPQEGTRLVHQQSYIYAFLQETLDPECLKDRRTPEEPESCPHKQHVPAQAQKARLKHPPLQEGQDPLEHTPILRLAGMLLWISLRTRPDIAWTVARITRLASSDESHARICIRHVAQYLRWTLHFTLFYELSRIVSGIVARIQVGHQKVITAIKPWPFTLDQPGCLAVSLKTSCCLVKR